MKNNQFGRSMLEMLGVLAIIGVLSVGGIAGYSKAMEKWKMNKAISEYSFIIYGVLEHIDDIYKMPVEESVNLNSLLESLNLIPDNWMIDGENLKDAYGNDIYVGVYPATSSAPVRVSMDLRLGGIMEDDKKSFSPAFSAKICQTMFTDLIIPLSDVIWASAVTRWKSGWEMFYGNNYCKEGRKCLQNLSLDEINRICNYCNGNSEVCAVNISF